MTPRYIVTELEGQLDMTGGPFRNGLSCMVIDTAYNRRLIATYRTEDYRAIPGVFGATLEQKFSYVRGMARDHASRLND